MTATSSAESGQPTEIEGRLQSEIERLVGGKLDDRRWGRIAEALKGLHGRFVSEQAPEDAEQRYFQEAHSLAAYLAYFFPASVAQVRRSLAEVEPPAKSVWRVLDVGSGPGPAAVAVADWAAASSARVEVTALEASPTALETMKRLWRPSSGTLTTRTWAAGAALPTGQFDVIVMAHVLNELFAGDPLRLDRRQKLVTELSKQLAPGGYLVLVEPALRRTGRELLVVRDRLLSSGMVARAPCFFQGNCPAIARPKDWCHADRPWKAPPLVTRAAEAAGLSRDSIKFSYVVLSEAASAPERSRDQGLFRIVSEPLPEKGKLRYFGCGPAGRHPLVRLDKEETPTNAAFDSLKRGDVVKLDGLVLSGDGRRLSSESHVDVTISAVDRDRIGR